jgi:hypothetical protein
MKKKILVIFLVTVVVLLIGITKAIGTNNPQEFKTLISTTESSTDSWLTSGNGEKISVSAGDRVQLKTKSQNHIRLQVNECVQICIIECDCTNECDCGQVGPLLTQTRAVNRFMHIAMNQTCAMNATMFRNYTNHELEGLGNVSTFRWAWYDELKNQWQYAHQNWVEITPDGATVFCETTHFSVWTILAPDLEVGKNPDPGTPFNAQNGTEFAVQAGNRYQIKTQSGFALQLQLNQSAGIIISEYEEAPQVMTQAQHQIRTQTMAIELNESKVQIQANFSYTFTNQIRNQLGVKNMEKLKFMFYNETSNEWETPKYQWLEGETLYCNTTHFSLWTIAEEETASSSSGFTIIPLFLALIPVFLLRIKRRS